MVALLLVVLGALNLGLMGLTDKDVVATVLGHNSVFERVFNVLVGLSGVWVAWHTWGGKRK